MAKKKQKFERNKDLENQLLKIGMFVIFAVVVIVAAYFIMDAVLKKSLKEESVFDEEVHLHIPIDDFRVIFEYAPEGHIHYEEIENEVLKNAFNNADDENKLIYIYFYQSDKVNQLHVDKIEEMNDTQTSYLFFVDISSSDYSYLEGEEGLDFGVLSEILEIRESKDSKASLLIIDLGYQNEDDENDEDDEERELYVVESHPTRILNRFELIIKAQPSVSEIE